MPRMIMTTVLAAALGAASLVTPQSADATTQCSYRPLLPARVVVNQSIVGLTTKLAVSGLNCGQNYSVSTQLVRLTDSYFMTWDGSGPDVESVYASEVTPGLYRTTAGDCFAYDNNYNTLTCSVSPASTVIKFGARPRLSVTRTGSVLTFKTIATRYSDYYGFTPVTAKVAIQRYAAGKWVTVHTATAYGRNGYTWKYARALRASYRALSLETSSAWEGHSLTVLR